MMQRKNRRSGVSRFLAALALAGALAMTAVACGDDDDESSTASNGGGSSEEKVLVGLITKTDGNPYFVAMREAAQKAAEEEGVELITATGKADADTASQISAIESMISRGVKGILITPASGEAVNPAITQAREAGVIVIALDSPVVPEDTTDALFATDNFKAGVLIGQHAKAKMEGKDIKLATLDVEPSNKTGQLRHDGFLKGLGFEKDDPRIVGSADSKAAIEGGQTAMESLLQKDPDINLVYAVNEPAGYGAQTALKRAGKVDDVLIETIDGGCEGVEGVQNGTFAATSQQYPGNMAKLGVEAVAAAARGGEKPSGYTDTGAKLITDDPVDGVASEDTAYGLQNCWG